MASPCVVFVLLGLVLGASASIGSFLSISDVHYDPYYLVNSSTSMGCHRGEGLAGVFGSRAVCDSPVVLVNSFFDFAATLPAPDFILWAGDNARHDHDSGFPRVAGEVTQELRYVATQMAKLQQSFPNNPLVIPCVGNNDMFPHDELALGPNPQLVNMSIAFKQFIPPSQLQNFLNYGTYYVNVTDSLSVLSINTMYWFKDNSDVDHCSDKKSAGQTMFTFVESLLETLKGYGRRVIMLGHVPPYDPYYFSSCSTLYQKIMTDYASIITTHVFAHTHADDTYSFGKSIPGVIHTVPSAMPTWNPAIREWTYDRTASTIVDYNQYYVDLDIANVKLSATWIKEYSALSAYNMPSFTADNWKAVLKSLETNVTLHELYQRYERVSVGYVPMPVYVDHD